MKKVLVTGSSGYVGKNFIGSYKDKYTFYKFSLLKSKFEDINFNNIDIILHCAALVHQKKEYSYEKYYEINVEYPVKLAKLAKENGVKQFVFISSISVYGEDKEKLDENTICKPKTYYGKSKLEAEKQILELNDDNFTVSILRIPMIYGKNAPGNIDSLIKLIKKIPILPFGGVENKRSFISIQNLLYIINEIFKQQKSGVFLLSDDELLSTNKLCKLIAKNLDKNVYIIKIPFFESLLKTVKPSLYKKLYGNLELNNSITKEKLFGKVKKTLPYRVDEGIKLMFHDE